ncbi:hypothetical protein SK128_027226, partial [Halocaridina rubra]
VTHNIPLLRDIFTEEKFIKGDISTNYLPEVYPDGFKGKQLSSKERHELIAVLASISVKNSLRSSSMLNESRLKINRNLPSSWNLIVDVAKKSTPCSVTVCDGNFKVHIEGTTVIVGSNFDLAAPLIEANIDGVQETVQLIKLGSAGEIRIRYKGTAFQTLVLPQNASHFLSLMPEKPKVDQSMQILSPMPGLVKSIACSPGDLVAEGQEVCVIEAMKMQNSLAAAATGKVKAVHIKVGDTVEEEQVLVELE